MYSRKVEHVYQLVQSTIDFLTQQKQQKNANASRSKNGDDDMAEGEVGHFYSHKCCKRLPTCFEEI